MDCAVHLLFALKLMDCVVYIVLPVLPQAGTWNVQGQVEQVVKPCKEQAGKFKP